MSDICASYSQSRPSLPFVAPLSQTSRAPKPFASGPTATLPSLPRETARARRRRAVCAVPHSRRLPRWPPQNSLLDLGTQDARRPRGHQHPSPPLWWQCRRHRIWHLFPAPLLTSSLLPTSSAAGSTSAVTGTAPLPIGLSLPLLPPLPSSSILHRDALRCDTCAGFIGPHCQVAHNAWTCGLCGSNNRALHLSAANVTAETHPELHAAVVEYAPPRLPPRGPPRPPPPPGAKAAATAAAAAAAATAADGPSRRRRSSSSSTRRRARRPSRRQSRRCVTRCHSCRPTLASASSPLAARSASISLERPRPAGDAGDGGGGGDDDDARPAMVEALALPALEPPVEWEIELLPPRGATRPRTPPRGRGAPAECPGGSRTATAAATRAHAALPPGRRREARARGAASRRERGLLRRSTSPSTCWRCCRRGRRASSSSSRRSRGRRRAAPAPYPVRSPRPRRRRRQRRRRHCHCRRARRCVTPRSPSCVSAGAASRARGRLPTSRVADDADARAFFDVEALRALVLPCAGAVSVHRPPAADAAPPLRAALEGALQRRSRARRPRPADRPRVARHLGGARRRRRRAV